MQPYLFLLLSSVLLIGIGGKEIGEHPGRHDLHPDLLPENTVVRENSVATLTCGVADLESTHSIQWWDFSSNPNGIPISDNENLGAHPNRDRYEIVKTHPNEYSLRISPVLMDDGGTYVCLDTWGIPSMKSRHALQLTVVAAEPLCITTLPEHGTVLDGNYHTHSCTLDYKGGLIPNMTWSGPGPFDSIYVATENQVFCGMQFTVNRAMDTRSHVLDIYFTDYFYPVDGDSSDIVPDYTYVFRQIQMFVYWAPTSMYHEPDKEVYAVGDILRCYSDAFPSADHMWQNLRTADIVDGDEIEIDAEWLGHNQTLRCEARNVIAGFTFTDNLFIPVYVPVPTTPTIPTTTIPSTLPPAVSDCFDLTGAWESNLPNRASLCLKLDLENNGILDGLARNHTDTFWVDVVGRSTGIRFNQVGFAGIWPLELGVSSFVGECHRCFGIERIIAHVTNRVRGDTSCGVVGPARHTAQFEFYRSTSLRCPNL